MPSSGNFFAILLAWLVETIAEFTKPTAKEVFCLLAWLLLQIPRKGGYLLSRWRRTQRSLYVPLLTNFCAVGLPTSADDFNLLEGWVVEMSDSCLVL